MGRNAMLPLAVTGAAVPKFSALSQMVCLGMQRRQNDRARSRGMSRCAVKADEAFYELPSGCVSGAGVGPQLF